jgi:PIN domain nuclease of toxin-antitoxin system
MESRLALDTHIIIWLYSKDFSQFTPKVQKLLHSSELIVSPMVRLELALLYEIGRVDSPPDMVFRDLQSTLAITVLDLGFALASKEAETLQWTRDPFDRLIVATSQATGIPLLTKDRNILANFNLAVW